MKNRYNGNAPRDIYRLFALFQTQTVYPVYGSSCPTSIFGQYVWTICLQEYRSKLSYWCHELPRLFPFLLQSNLTIYFFMHWWEWIHSILATSFVEFSNPLLPWIEIWKFGKEKDPSKSTLVWIISVQSKCTESLDKMIEYIEALKIRQYGNVKKCSLSITIFSLWKIKYLW